DTLHGHLRIPSLTPLGEALVCGKDDAQDVAQSRLLDDEIDVRPVELQSGSEVARISERWMPVVVVRRGVAIPPSELRLDRVEGEGVESLGLASIQIADHIRFRSADGDRPCGVAEQEERSPAAAPEKVMAR